MKHQITNFTSTGNDLCSYQPVESKQYTQFNEFILKAATETATKSNTPDKGWFHHSLSTLLPTISHRDQLLHTLRTTEPSSLNTTAIKIDLKLAQIEVTDSISLAKAKWSAHQAERIHNMRFNPKDAWKAVKVLIVGKESNHLKPVVMRLRQPTGKLATSDAENVNIMPPHLEKVFKAQRPITWAALDDNIK